MVSRIAILTRTLFAVLLLCTGMSSLAHAEKRVALVIGNSAYRNVTPLENPKADAALMANTLKDLGFAVVGGGAQLDLDKVGFDQALHRFGDLLVGADVALFYYAGHGVEVQGWNYLVPVDASPKSAADIMGQLVNVSDALQRMQNSGARVDLVLLDACRDNPFKGQGGARGLVQMSAPVGTLISFATQPRSTALDGDDGHSPYTRALTRTMRKPGYGLFRTFNEVGLEVAKVTGGGQVPWVSSSPIDGNFYFAGKLGSDGTEQPDGPRDAIHEARLLPSQVTLSPPGDPLRRDLVTDCDRLATMPNDTGRANGMAGVEMDDLRIAAAASACNDAMQRYPDVARFTYQAGRVATARKQWAEARRLYDKAAAAGYGMAMNNIGGIYEGGEGAPVNYTEAVNWYGKAAAAGEPVAMTNLGWLYEKGKGVPRDYAHARRLYEQADSLGEPNGTNNLGILYMYGTGVNRDYAEARRLFEQCVAMNNAACMNGLGVLYNTGEGVPRDHATARRWFEKAAALGNPEAKLNLK